MPLSKIQIDILRLLALHRDPESYVAGSTPLTQDTSRFSGDIDIFHDREERVGQAATQDIALLHEHGYMVQWIRPGPDVYAVQAERLGVKTRLEWVSDSDFRFIPARGPRCPARSRPLG